MSAVVSGFVEEGGGGEKEQEQAKKKRLLKEGGMQKQKIDRRWTGENGRERTRRANEKGIRRTLSTSNRAGSKSPKDSNTSTRWGSVKTSALTCLSLPSAHLSLFHGFHCEPFTTFTFAEGRREDGEDSLFLDLRGKRMG